MGAPQSDVPKGSYQAATENTELPQEAGTAHDAEQNLESNRTKATRKEAFDAVVSAGFALLALWLVGSLFLNSQPWLKLGQELLANVAWPGN